LIDATVVLQNRVAAAVASSPQPIQKKKTLSKIGSSTKKQFSLLSFNRNKDTEIEKIFSFFLS
jgi:hypothetical protein